ncbi:hypothetical protein ACRAWF_19580 [Streptomyces sp. L7]
MAQRSRCGGGSGSPCAGARSRRWPGCCGCGGASAATAGVMVSAIGAFVSIAALVADVLRGDADPAPRSADEDRRRARRRARRGRTGAVVRRGQAATVAGPRPAGRGLGSGRAVAGRSPGEHRAGPVAARAPWAADRGRHRVVRRAARTAAGGAGRSGVGQECAGDAVRAGAAGRAAVRRSGPGDLPAGGLGPEADRAAGLAR